MAPSPVISLNRAVAIAMADGPQAGLALVDDLATDLDAYHLFHSARADLLRRLNRPDGGRGVVPARARAGDERTRSARSSSGACSTSLRPDHLRPKTYDPVVPNTAPFDRAARHPTAR